MPTNKPDGTYTATMKHDEDDYEPYDSDAEYAGFDVVIEGEEDSSDEDDN